MKSLTRWLFLFAGVVFLQLSAEESFEFRGKHFLGSYLHCDSTAICDEEQLKQIMLKAAEECGAQVLNHSAHVFPGHGLTMVILLSESHASIHTYPEHGACFVDLFTCGDHCKHDRFHEVLLSYLKPQTINHKVLIRHHSVEELR